MSVFSEVIELEFDGGEISVARSGDKARLVGTDFFELRVPDGDTRGENEGTLFWENNGVVLVCISFVIAGVSGSGESAYVIVLVSGSEALQATYASLGGFLPCAPFR